MVGFPAGIAVTPAVQLFADRHPDLNRGHAANPVGRPGPDAARRRIDVGYVRCPSTRPACASPRCTPSRGGGAARGHRLAGRSRHLGRPGREPAGLACDYEHASHQAPHLTPGTRLRGWTRRSSMSRPPGHLVPGPFGNRSTHSDSSTCPSRIWHPTVCLAMRQRATSPVVRRLLPRGSGDGRDHGRMAEL